MYTIDSTNIFIATLNRVGVQKETIKFLLKLTIVFTKVGTLIITTINNKQYVARVYTDNSFVNVKTNTRPIFNTGNLASK